MNITNPEMMITYDDTTGRFVFFEIRSYPPRKKFWVWRLLDISIIKNGASGGGANFSPNVSEAMSEVIRRYGRLLNHLARLVLEVLDDTKFEATHFHKGVTVGSFESAVRIMVHQQYFL